MTWQRVGKEETQRKEVEDWELVLIVVATGAESALSFSVFGTLWREGFKETEGEKQNKLK